jgi:hypothetical protein
MQAYRFSSPQPPFAVTLCAAFGFICLLDAVYSATEDSAFRRGGLYALVGIPLVAAAISLGCEVVDQIQVDDDGMVAFVAPKRATHVAARDITRLSGEYVPAYDGGQLWYLHIGHSTGHYTFGEFEDVMGFVEWVKTHNPDVKITGLWPMGPP